MYKSDYLEILWLLKREGVEDKRINRAAGMLKSRMLPEGIWVPERNPGKLIIPFANKRDGSIFATKRANEVIR